MTNDTEEMDEECWSDDHRVGELEMENHRLTKEITQLKQQLELAQQKIAQLKQQPQAFTRSMLRASLVKSQ